MIRIITQKKMYIGDTVKKPGKELFKMRIGRFNPFLYLLCIPDGEDSLEIYRAILLKQKMFKGTTIRLVGMTTDYDEAIELVKKIVDDTHATLGNYNIREYLLT